MPATIEGFALALKNTDADLRVYPDSRVLLPRDVAERIWANHWRALGTGYRPAFCDVVIDLLCQATRPGAWADGVQAREYYIGDATYQGAQWMCWAAVEKPRTYADARVTYYGQQLTYGPLLGIGTEALAVSL